MRNIPYGHQSIDRNDIEEVVKILKSDWLTQGPKIAEFERALSEYTGAKYAVVVSSGTAALHIACLAAGLSAGQEIITSPITFPASANCALYCMAKPIFADVYPDSANIDPFSIKKRITDKTKIIIPVHFAGLPCELKKINAIAKKNKLLVIEDAAHALGAEYHGSKIGSCKYSDMAIFSFHPVKSVTTGEGGAVLTNSGDLYRRLQMFRNHGITKDPRCLKSKVPQDKWYYEMQELGFNYRITDLQAALGLAQLKKLDRFIGKRKIIAEVYDSAFRNNSYFDIPDREKDAHSAHHLYPIRLKDRLKHKKKEIFSALREKGLGVQVHYIPVFAHPYYHRMKLGDNCPQAEDFYAREISIPIYPGLNEEELNYIIRTVFLVFKEIDHGK